MSQTSMPAWLADATDAFVRGDVDAFCRIYAPDAVHEFPFAPDGMPRRLVGRDAIADHLRHVSERVRFGTFTDLRVHSSADELIVEVTGHHRNVADDTPLHIGFIWFITHDGGRVSHFRDYMHVLPPAEPEPVPATA